MTINSLGFSLVLGLALLTGCKAAVLEQAPEAQRPENSYRAAETVESNVRVLAEVESWNAPENVRHEVTALRITVKNMRNEPLNLRYEGFELVAGDGETFQPIDPKDVSIRGQQRSLSLDPEAYQTRGSGAGLNTMYLGEEDRETVRAQMLADALKAGELEPGAERTGFVFFRKVPSTKDRITLLSKLESARTGQVVAEARIPFRVRPH